MCYNTVAGNLGHAFANSENSDEAVNEPSQQDFHCLLS